MELHLHLEGSIRPTTMPALSHSRPGIVVDLSDGWQNSYYTYRDFGEFLAQLTPRVPWEPAEYARIARECFEDQARQNVIYVEPSFDVPTREVGDDSRFWPIMEALEEERQRAESLYPMRITFVAGLMRSLPPEVGEYRVRLAIAARDRGYCIGGIDLHGDEMVGAPRLFERAYDMARDAGLQLRAHAGEVLGPGSIWDAVRSLQPRRIAHGIRAFDDPSLIERLRRDGITLDICPTSNVRTAVVPSIDQHPIRRFYDEGIRITVGSDDPLPFFTDIEREYRLMAEVFGFGLNDFRRINLYALQAAFMPDEAERERLNRKLTASYDTVAV